MQPEFQKLTSDADKKIKETEALLNQELQEIQVEIEKRDSIIKTLDREVLTSYLPFIEEVESLAPVKEYKFNFQVKIQDNTDIVEKFIKNLMSIDVINSNHD